MIYPKLNELAVNYADRRELFQKSERLTTEPQRKQLKTPSAGGSALPQYLRGSKWLFKDILCNLYKRSIIKNPAGAGFFDHYQAGEAFSCLSSGLCFAQKG